MIGLVATLLLAIVVVAWLAVLSRRQRSLAHRLALHVCREPSAALHRGRHARR